MGECHREWQSIYISPEALRETRADWLDDSPGQLIAAAEQMTVRGHPDVGDF